MLLKMISIILQIDAPLSSMNLYFKKGNHFVYLFNKEIRQNMYNIERIHQKYFNSYLLYVKG
jgi:hypothetical protein